VLRIEPSRHKCLIYEGDPSEQLPVIIPLLKDGLETNWRCLYIGSPQMVSMIQLALKAEGIDVVGETRRSALVLSSERNLLSDGRFDPKLMTDALSHLVDTAVRDGFRGLCATGDMKWELGRERNFHHLLEYEARLEQIFRHKPIRGICQYQRGLVPPASVRDALLAHRSVYIGRAFRRDNPFYTPPEALLDARRTGSTSKQVDRMIRKVLHAADSENRSNEAGDDPRPS